MQFSVRQLLAPGVGALLGWMTAHGFQAPPGTAEVLVAAGAWAVAALVHLVEAYVGPKAAPRITTVAGSADPARGTPKGGGGGSSAASALLCALALGLIAGTAGCAGLGAAPPDSPDESIAYGVGLYTGVENALAAAVAAHEVTPAQAAAVDARAGQARALLNAARAAELADPTGAATDLARATQLLQALQTWVNDPAGAIP